MRRFKDSSVDDLVFEILNSEYEGWIAKEAHDDKALQIAAENGEKALSELAWRARAYDAIRLDRKENWNG